MPRNLRIDYPGAWHHVMNRGIDRQAVFVTPQLHRVWLMCVAQGFSRHGVEVHAYCTMENHFHLLVRSVDGHLSHAMQYTAGRFTQWVNDTQGRDGALFRGRFRSVLIEREAHILLVSRYIHLNPVAASLVHLPVAWPWSSAAAYEGQVAIPDWLTCERLLDSFGPVGRRQGYREFVNSGIDPATQSFYQRKRLPRKFTDRGMGRK